MAKIIEMCVPEKILAVEEIWDSIRSRSFPVTADQKKKIDRRLKSVATKPDSGAPWDVVRHRIEKRSRK